MTDTPRDRVLARLHLLVRGLREPAGPLLAGQLRSPGKLLRSALLDAAASCGPHDRDRVVRAGAVVELLHLASLVHDDVIDRAGTRRGVPSVHAVAGGGLATMAGLSCLSLAGTEAADLGPGVAARVAATAAELSRGEMLDVERAFDTSYPPEDYRELVERKTGALFRLCAELGAASAGLPPGPVEAAGWFGTELGVAFQILDDCQDLSPSGTGKPSGTDHLLGLFGAPTLHALRADRSGALESLLLSPSFSTADLPRLRSMVRESGGLDAASREARAAYRRALSHLDSLPEPGRDRMHQVAVSAWRSPAPAPARPR